MRRGTAGLSPVALFCKSEGFDVSLVLRSGSPGHSRDMSYAPFGGWDCQGWSKVGRDGRQQPLEGYDDHVGIAFLGVRQ